MAARKSEAAEQFYTLGVFFDQRSKLFGGLTFAGHDPHEGTLGETGGKARGLFDVGTKGSERAL
ncbi:MAG: hypothetical protein VYE40_12560 [Myxococcota bacterium]|jgi:hypothetical protein|nr:hypothetical protein [Myxococcota bacterium]